MIQRPDLLRGTPQLPETESARALDRR